MAKTVKEYEGILEQRHDERKAGNILRANRQKNFVKRILEPKKYPVIKNYKGSGMGASHQMSWGETDTKQGRKYHVFPNIVQDKTGQLKDLGKQSYKYALDNKEAIQFNTAKEADWFSRKYKSVWKKK